MNDRLSFPLLAEEHRRHDAESIGEIVHRWLVRQGIDQDSDRDIRKADGSQHETAAVA